jgi:type VI secretion system secreted protein Hcp
MAAFRNAYRRSKGTMGWILAAVILALPWLTMSGALEIFLELNGINGESDHPRHKGKIEVLAWSWGASNSGTTHMGTDAGAGKASFQDISLTKWIDKSSPVLMLHLASGKHITDGKLYVARSGDKTDFLTFDIQNILVTSQSQGGSTGEDRLTENISLNFAAFTISYQQLATDGSTIGSPVTTSWNIVENK